MARGRRVVLVEMPTEDAELWVRASANINAEYADFSPNDLENVLAKAEIVGVVARPTKPCVCAIAAESPGQRRRRLKRKESTGWSRGKALGWWICPQCRKPSRAAVIHWISSMLVGANDLLPQILGIGDPIPPSMRWLRDGGVPNEHADADPHSPGIVAAKNGVTKQRKRPRRSELDRLARERRS